MSARTAWNGLGGRTLAELTFTQYLRPDGRTQQITCHVQEPEVAEAARRLTEAGARFEAEVLTTGEVSFTVEADGEDGEDQLLAIEIVPNKVPDVPEAVNRLLLAAAERLRGANVG